MLGTYLENLSWQDAESMLRAAKLVLVPIGARCKEHGYHLPLCADWVLAEYLTRRVLEQQPVVALPTVQYGYYPAFLEYPGSISIDRAAFESVLCDICRSLARHSNAKFYFLNTGISTNRALEPARLVLQAEGIIAEFTDLTTITKDVEESVITQPRGTHADEIETSMMLYVRPDLVRLERAQPELSDRTGPGPLMRSTGQPGIYSPSGAWGDPTRASVEKGKLLVESLLMRVVKQLQDLLSDRYVPPPARDAYL